MTTLYPLQIKENIALGNPDLALDDDKVREAARLGGAEGFVDKLPEGFETYLDRPVRDYYSPLPEGTTMLFGRKVDYKRIRGAGAMRATDKSALSGGQMQRLAVYVDCFLLYYHVVNVAAPVPLSPPVREHLCARLSPRRNLPLVSFSLMNRALRSIRAQSTVCYVQSFCFVRSFAHPLRPTT